MPELPEVETVRRGLNQVTPGQMIVGGEVLLARTIAHPIPIGNFLSGLKGMAIAHWHRRGKYLLAELTKLRSVESVGDRETRRQGDKGVEENTGTRGHGLPPRPVPLKSPNASAERDTGNFQDSSPLPPLALFPHSGRSPSSPHPPISSSNYLTTNQSAGWLGVHLRMTGQLLWLDASVPLQTHTRVRLFFAQNRELRFVDQRTFGQMWWVTPDESLVNVISGLRSLGPEPLSEGFSVEYLARQLQNRRRPIKNLLLDQALVAGVGNIYADEALFLSGIHPKTLGADLNLEQIERLRAAIIQVLETSIAQGGTTFRSFLSVQGVNGNYSGVAWVYNRTGKPCRVCAAPIQRLKLAGRSTHFCSHCQS